MKDIIDIYEGVLGDIDDQIESMDIYVQLNTLYKNLCCYGTASTWKEGVNWLKSYLDSRPELKVKKSGLYSWLNHVFPKDKTKDYIEFVSYGHNTDLKIIVDGMTFWLMSQYPIEDPYFPSHSYKFFEGDLHFHGSKGENIYIVPNELKPFIDRCIDTILKRARTKVKIKR